MKVNPFILWISIVSLCVSCSQSEVKAGIEGETPTRAEPLDTVTSTEEKKEKKEEKKKGGKEEIVEVQKIDQCIDVPVVYPIDSSKVRVTNIYREDSSFIINAPIVEGFEEVCGRVLDSAKADMNRLLLEYKHMFEPGEYCADPENQDSYSCRWDYESNVYSHYLNDKIQSFMIYVYMYAGGVHGNVYYITFNFQNGAILELHDIVPQGETTELERLVIERLREQGASDAYYKDSMDLAEYNFVVDPKGIEFHFAPYEVGSYVEGSFCVRVEWKEIPESVSPFFLDGFER